MANDKTRIIHVIFSMNRGGIETWLMNLLRHADQTRFQMDFLVHTTQPCEYDNEILELGSRILPCPWPTKPFRYAWKLKQILKEYGPYNVIHSHVHHFSGWVLRTAHKACVRIRIAHSHSDISILQKQESMTRKLYYAYTELLIRKHATHGLAASQKAAESLFGSNWQLDPRYKVLHCGIDLTPFSKSIEKKPIREELGIPADAFVIGHVGKFTKPKNHAFLIDIIAEALQREPSIRALLIGDGELFREIKEKAQERGLNDIIYFLGSRDDVPRFMLGAMDIFVFPSLWEGLGLALIEAQAAGLPCIVSDRVPQETEVVPPLLNKFPLTQPARLWADKIIEYRNKKMMSLPSQQEAFARVYQSPFNITANLNALESLYKTR